MPYRYSLELNKRWTRVQHLNDALSALGAPLAEYVDELSVRFSQAVMLDAAVVVLSLANQAAASGRRVTLVFDAGMEGVMGYLDRMGFFDKLHPAILTKPERPALSGAHVYGGTRSGIVEFQSIRPDHPTNPVPEQLAASLEDVCAGRPDGKELSDLAFTLFGELVENIYGHSETVLDGFAAFQVYPNGNKACVVVSDSGDGILETLRPTLDRKKWGSLSDAQLILAMFNEGISRHGPGRGCGLPACARAALRYRFKLNLRLPTCNVELVPAPASGGVNVAYCTDNLPRIQGTHIAFDFALDKSS